MNVEIRTETAQFPEKEYINGILVPVQGGMLGQITFMYIQYIILYSITILRILLIC
jgi:hypothetical protein